MSIIVVLEDSNTSLNCALLSGSYQFLEHLGYIFYLRASYDTFFHFYICRDIFPILRNPDVFQDLMDVMIDHVKQLNCDVIVGLEARGFLFGPVMSLALKKPFVPIRKKGKLPGDCIQVEYRLEYGSVSCGPIMHLAYLDLLFAPLNISFIVKNKIFHFKIANGLGLSLHLL